MKIDQYLAKIWTKCNRLL